MTDIFEDTIVVTAQRPMETWQIEAIKAALSSEADGGGYTDAQYGGGGAVAKTGIEALIDFFVSFFANVAADQLSEEEQSAADERERNSSFDQRDVTGTSSVGGTGTDLDGTTIRHMNDGTWWFDVDKDGTPDTHVFGLDGIGVYYDSNSDGAPDTNLNHLFNGPPG